MFTTYFRHTAYKQPKENFYQLEAPLSPNEINESLEIECGNFIFFSNLSVALEFLNYHIDHYAGNKLDFLDFVDSHIIGPKSTFNRFAQKDINRVQKIQDWINRKCKSLNKEPICDRVSQLQKDIHAEEQLRKAKKERDKEIPIIAITCCTDSLETELSKLKCEDCQIKKLIEESFEKDVVFKANEKREIYKDNLDLYKRYLLEGLDEANKTMDRMINESSWDKYKPGNNNPYARAARTLTYLFNKERAKFFSSCLSTKSDKIEVDDPRIWIDDTTGSKEYFGKMLRLNSKGERYWSSEDVEKLFLMHFKGFGEITKFEKLTPNLKAGDLCYFLGEFYEQFLKGTKANLKKKEYAALVKEWFEQFNDWESDTIYKKFSQKPSYYPFT